jgi:anti-anti-sigma factor
LFEEIVKSMEQDPPSAAFPPGRGLEPVATVRVEHREGVTVACVYGEIDASNVSEVERRLTAGIPPGALGLVVDLTGVDYFTSATIKMLFGLSERLRDRKQQLRVAIHDAAPMRAVLSLVNFDRLISLHPNSEEARIGILGRRER